MVSIAWSLSGMRGAKAFAFLFSGCLLWKLLGNGQSIYLVGLVTLPFSLACYAAANLLQDTFGLSFEVRSWAEWGLLGVTGLVEFYFIGHALGGAWRRNA